MNEKAKTCNKKLSKQFSGVRDKRSRREIKKIDRIFLNLEIFMEIQVRRENEKINYISFRKVKMVSTRQVMRRSKSLHFLL